MTKFTFISLFLAIFAISILGQTPDSVAFKVELDELTVTGSIRADENTPVTEKTIEGTLV